MKIFRPFLLLLLVAMTTFLTAQETVWPGDVNNNGVVTGADLLYLGLGFGDSGAKRKDTTVLWTQEFITTPWATSAVPGLDLSLADCNGDGDIDANDVAVIKRNFGKRHSDGTSLPDEILVATPGIDPAFNVPENTDLDIFPNTPITIPIHLGNDSLSVESLLGIAFSIRVNGQAFDESATTFQLNGWLPSNNAEIIRNDDLEESVTKNDPEKYIVAYTKTDKRASGGNGLIGELTLSPGFVVIGDVPDFRITIDSVTLIDEQRNLTPVVGTEITFNPVRFLDSTAANTTICQGDSINFNNDLLTESGIYRDTLKNVFGGDSISILNLNVIPNPAATINETICQDEIYLFGEDTLRQAGTYTNMSQAFNGCDSTTTLELTVLDTLQTVIEKTICQGDSFEFKDQFLTTAGNYRDTLTAANGCNQYVVLNLTVDDTLQSIIDRTICQGDSFEFNNQFLTTAGNYRDTLTAANGCNQYVVLNLTVDDTLQSVIDRTICQGDSFEFNGQFLTTAGNYRDTLTAANGCDQYVVLNLAVDDTLQSVIDRTICQGDMFAFNGQTLMDAGTYRDTQIAANGCDQYIVLNLSVAEKFQTTLTQSICQGEAYLFGEEARVESGIYQQNLSAMNGCDSVVTLHLTVNEIAETSISQTICETAVYDFNGQALATAGIYRDTLATVNGCDSFVVLILKVSDRFETELNKAICVGESMSFNGQTIDASGIYQQDFVAANGCDSMVTLNLTVNATDFTALSEEICAGSSRSFNGHDLSEAGTYLDTLSTQNGCDSMVELILTVAPMIESTSEQTICTGDTIEFHTFILTETNSYTAMLKTAEGCDSMVILNLLVLENIETTIEEMLCPQDSLLFGGDMLTEAGVYTQNLISTDGCDSTVTLNLTMGVAGAGGCQSVSIEEAFLQSIEIYPNPVRQSLFINAPTVQLNHIRLINLTGQVLKAQTFNRGNSPIQQEINMADVVPGVYWVLIQTEYGLRQEKIVKF